MALCLKKKCLEPLQITLTVLLKSFFHYVQEIFIMENIKARGVCGEIMAWFLDNYPLLGIVFDKIFN